MAFDTLISARELAARIERPDWVVVDCRFDLSDAEAGQRVWREGHVPGARYAHLEADLSGPETGESGRHPLPDPDRFAARLGEWGIEPTHQIVAYDDQGGIFAARLWWLMRWFGHRHVAVLDGGLGAWIDAGGKLDARVPEPDLTRYIGRPRHSLWLETAQIEMMVDNQRRGRVVDARSPERFRGEREPMDPVAGHIPGAVNRPWQENLDARGRFRKASELRERFTSAMGDHPPSDVVHMCGSGVTACHNLLAMEHADLHGSRLYAGSWSEWINDPSHAVMRSGSGE